ncbi:MAG: deoxyuridine 5'-triphosphate nucleotidohydrolase [Archaeoglobus sp.]|nr:MAG: deoxyuridine 5'-triphosphate nucleotidohydrolase [Archaeoglobus sp.]
MSVLCDREIKRLIKSRGLIRDYIDLDKQVQPNGFDCTLKSVYRLTGIGKIDFDNAERVIPDAEEIKFNNDWVFLNSGVYRAKINEIISLPKDIMALARPRSSILRCGVNVLTAVWDAGYTGRSEVGIVVYNGVWLKKNARIVQLVFIRLDEESHGYSGIYQNEGL